MTKQELTLYLTYEFGTQFGLKSLKRIIHHREAKIWVDEETGYPSFSYGGYHGRRTEDGELLRIGCNEIHVRVDRALIEKLALLEACEGLDGFEYNVAKATFIASVFKQIERQVGSVFDAFKTAQMQQLVKEKSIEVAEINVLISSLKKEEKRHVAH